jgi:hypothetical protein
VWLEAVQPAEDGTWYGYYHNENVPTRLCDGTSKVLPRIGAARSTDRGATWENLGIILEAPPRTHDCNTSNTYFVGGVGDFSVMLDANRQDLYIFYTQYPRWSPLQGVSVARLAWADRDEPVGRVAVWQNGVWLPPRPFVRDSPGEGQPPMPRWVYPAATPIYPAANSWHDEDAIVDAFWGPSVHWNTHLQQYVMLLNRARNADWEQEGIYVAFAPTLDDPQSWTIPDKILDGGSWYPQVVGTEPGVGTDRIAGESARLFIEGRSEHLIRFIR